MKKYISTTSFEKMSVIVYYTYNKVSLLDLLTRIFVSGIP